jgi:hypothetical protein
MDLHNNRIGRELFLNSFGKYEDVVPLLVQKTNEAVKVRIVREIEEVREKLVYIEDVRSL